MLDSWLIFDHESNINNPGLGSYPQTGIGGGRDALRIVETARMRPSDLPRVLDAAVAQQLGISRARMRTEVDRGRWRPLARGIVLTRPDEPTRADWAAVGFSLAGGHGVLSGWDAVRRYGIGSTVASHPRVLVLTDRGGGRSVGAAQIRRVSGPLPARTASIDDAELPLVQLAEPARAVADTALASRARSSVRGLVTAAVQRQLCTVEELHAAVRVVSRRHSLPLRNAVTDALDGARSAAEAAALAQLRLAPVPPFELNVPITDSAGQVIAVVDVLWRELRAVLEIDSREYHFTEADWKRTGARHNRLTAAGLSLVHYPPSRITASGGWLAEIISWLRARATELGVPYVGEPAVIRDGPPLPLRC